MSWNIDTWQAIGLILDYGIKIFAIGYVPEGRKPSSSTAWLLAILLIPFIGLPLFLIMGSPYVSRRRHRIQREANAMIEDVQADVPDYPEGANFTPEIESLFKLNRSLTNLPAVVGKNKGVWTDYNATIARMAEAVDEAQEFVHAEIYITVWDDTTDQFFQACKRAVERGVTVRYMFDQIGSFKYPKSSKLKKRLEAIGVQTYEMLPLAPWRGRFRRPDLRNHRKMLIIDGETGFLGSFNMIERGYVMKNHKRAGRQWIDTMVELEGPIVDSMNMIFSVDWYSESEEPLDVTDHYQEPEIPEDDTSSDNIVQLVPSGPGYSTEPNLRMFNSIIHHAKERLIMCSPYFIPDESMLDAVTTACYRGVRVELLVGEASDQFMVNHAQSSYYQALLEAGVKIYQFPKPYILHSKFVITDPDNPELSPLAVVGSSNMDMRSFGLNYEVSLMVARGNLITQLNETAAAYLAVSPELTLERWNERGWGRRYVDNVMRLTSALQ